MDLLNVNNKQLILPLVTGLGAFSGFPDPPELLKKLSGNVLVQWLMVFALIWQGGGGQNIQVSAVATALLFALKMVLNMLKL